MKVEFLEVLFKVKIETQNRLDSLADAEAMTYDEKTAKIVQAKEKKEIELLEKKVLLMDNLIGIYISQHR